MNENDIKTSECIIVKNMLIDFAEVEQTLDNNKDKIIIGEIYQYEVNELIRLGMSDFLDKAFKKCDVMRLVSNPRGLIVENGGYYKEFMADQQDLRFMSNSDKHIISKELKHIDELNTEIKRLVSVKPDGFNERIEEVQTKIERVNLNIAFVNAVTKTDEFKGFKSGLNEQKISIKADY